VKCQKCKQTFKNQKELINHYTKNSSCLKVLVKEIKLKLKDLEEQRKKEI
jgi:uncharacterized C2H2 Zn-finger protein